MIALASLLLASLALAPAGADEPADPPVWILRGATVYDGTGAPGIRADLAISGDRIQAVGKLEIPAGARVLNAEGLIVAPGFIDLHTHSDRPIVQAETRGNRNYLAQGVTTIVTGNCGFGPVDVADYFRAIESGGAGSNVIHLLPHGSLRAQVMGNDDRAPTIDELRQMERLAERAMLDGAWGMSTGLIYVPGRSAKTDELISIAKVVGRHGGLHASHIRNEGTRLLESIDEALRIGREGPCPVHISHLKASGKAAWGMIEPALAAIDAARKSGQVVSADQYPYVASSTALAAMVVPDWAIRGSSSDFAKLADSPESGARLRDEIRKALEARNSGASVRLARYAPRPEWVGKSLAEIAEMEKIEPVDVVVQVQRNGGAGAISFGMSEADVRTAMKSEWVATASDGSSHPMGGEDRPHPRSFGTFPRKIRYALDEKVIPLEQAIRSCSGLPASILGLRDRGVIRPGAIADLVVFDPATFRDAATFDDPKQLAPGVRHLFVNGQPAILEGQAQERLSGRVLRRDREGSADLILKVGRIWTGDLQKPRASALAVRGGEIVAVGDDAEVDAWKGPATRTIEHRQGFAVPGLIDAHGHMTMLGESVEEIDLRGVASLDEVAKLVKERIRTTPGDGWILGRNWDQSLWPGGEFPTAAVLDAVAKDRPVWLRRVDGHAAWANSEAMRRASVDAQSKAPSDGQIIRHPDGRPTGVFVDGAMELVGRVVPGPSREDLARQILKAQKALLEVGVTGVHDAGISETVASVYRELDRAGKLKVRVHAMAGPPTGGEVAFVSKPPEKAGPGSRFQMRAIKLFMDGAMGSRGALLFEPYADDPANTGLFLIQPDVLEETTKTALRNGWQVCTHAIGDRANAIVLDAYEAARRAVPEATDPRLRVEHAQVVRREDVERFRKAGVIASMQPSHASTDQRWADARLGKGRVDGAYAWGWFAKDRVELAFGSDFPVEVANPMWGVYAALTRQTEAGKPPGGWHPEHILPLETTLRAFTSGAARASFDEGRIGVLRPGMRADVTVLDRDLFEASPRDVLGAKVLETIIDGERLYSAGR